MADKRNCITNFVDYISSLGIKINIAKNKAQGNKGFFKAANDQYRIDVAKGLSESDMLKVLVHEFIHYLHFSYDKTLKSTDFLFNNSFCNFEDELINLTVESIPKASIEPLFKLKTQLSNEIKSISSSLKMTFPNFKMSEPCKNLENIIRNSELKHLLKHDNVKVFKGLGYKYYSIKSIEDGFPNLDENIAKYLVLLSKKRALKRINSRISRLNRY